MTKVDLGRDTSGRPLIVDDTWLAKLRWAEAQLGFKFTIVQGSWRGSHGAADSAQTHARGGVADLRTWNIPKHIGVWQALTALRRAGLIAWYRTPAQGFDYHIHAIDYGNPDLSADARDQVVQWEHGQNGLRSHGKDDGPRVAVPKHVPSSAPVHPDETAAKTSWVVDAFHGQWEQGLRPQMLLDQGYTAMIVKASQGTHFVDPHFLDWLRACEKCGLPIAAYHFLERGNAAKQADLFLRVVKDPEIPLATDAEMGGHPTWADIRAFESRLIEHGRDLRYLPRSYWAAIGSPDLAGHALWNAAYPTNDRGYPSRLYRGNTDDHWDGYGGTRITLWQFTSHGKVDGYPGNTDVSAFRGSPAELLKLGLFKLWPNSPNHPEEDMPFTDWPQKDQDALVKAVLNAPVTNENPDGTKTTGTLAGILSNIELNQDQGNARRNKDLKDIRDLLEEAIAAGKSEGAEA